MPVAHIPHGFQALNAETNQSRRRIFVIFQDVIRNLLPSDRQQLPTLRVTRATVLQSSTSSRVICGSFIPNRCSFKNSRRYTALKRTRSSAREARGDRLCPSVNERETIFSLGNFCRITFSNLADFLNLSVATCAVLNRAQTFFVASAPDLQHSSVNRFDWRGIAA